ncbi:MAG: hypothetical protein IJY78_03650 [Bacteroidaceae bacterium]|nr:hypothetical protein [Bacteroidaceae bacterium]
MKKIFSYLMLCVSVCLLSCSDDENLNNGEAMVSMKQSELSVKESKGIFNIPLVVTGEQNGPIKIDVEVVSSDADCIEDKHYLVTSKHIVIPESKSESRIEIRAVDDHDINPDRSFEVQIKSVKGANIDASNSKTLVTLLDNDNMPYDRMGGTWTVYALEMFNNIPYSWNTELIVYDEDTEEYGKEFVMGPWVDAAGNPLDVETFRIPLEFSYNETTMHASVSIRLGTVMAEGLDFDSSADKSDEDSQSCTIVLGTLSNVGISESGKITGTVSEDFTHIKFNASLLGTIYTKSGKMLGQYFVFDDISMRFNK